MIDVVAKKYLEGNSEKECPHFERKIFICKDNRVRGICTVLCEHGAKAIRDFEEDVLKSWE